MGGGRKDGGEMNPTSQHLEGKLLDYAYGELSEGEAKTVEAHLSDCPQCADSLTAMKQVRRTMAQLPIAAAPQAGLESLLAYAQKAAETRARPARRRTWLRWIVPAGSIAALSLILVLSSKVMMQHRPEGAATFKR
ncbi:MAG TPA: zf-HC2 domain-containing protein, partial [Myxococcaceae bacterium]|nr:zf-HC2 domain-containing protein [Myxococcaceae bacterium]